MTDSATKKRKPPTRFTSLVEDRLTLFNRLLDAGCSPDRANWIADRLSRGIYQLKKGVIVGPGDRPIFRLSNAQTSKHHAIPTIGE